MALSEGLIFSEGQLGRRMKEMIGAMLSSRNDCSYCADSHGFFLRMNGGSSEDLKCALAGGVGASTFSEKERVLLEFAQKVNEQSQAIVPTDIEGLRNAGWMDGQIAEAIHVSALFATYNRVANAFGLESQGLLGLLEESKQ
jgi:uncharacterized peroxidase-related enzyme